MQLSTNTPISIRPSKFRHKDLITNLSLKCQVLENGKQFFYSMPELSGTTADLFVAYISLWTTIILMQFKNPTELYNKVWCSIITKMCDDFPWCLCSSIPHSNYDAYALYLN